MLFIYDSVNCTFKRIKKKAYLIVSTILLIFSVGYGVVMYQLGYNKSIETIENYEREIRIASMDEFSEEYLIKMMKDLNIRFPHISLAQSMLETGFWKSDIFLENHNLFGMKEAKRRITTAIGTNKNHAHYNSWRESVYDYAFYQCRYLSKVNTEDEYYLYLAASYAEDTTYVSKIKNIVDRYQLKNKFD